MDPHLFTDRQWHTLLIGAAVFGGFVGWVTVRVLEAIIGKLGVGRH